LQILFGTCSTWFLLDVAYYCNNLYTPEILKAMGWASSVAAADTAANGTSIFNSVFSQASGSCFVILIGLLPGYIFTIALVEKMGRKTIQYMGFTMMTILLVVIAAAWYPLRTHAVWGMVAIYALTFFFANFGPNTTTFIIPGEAFPTHVRSTCHGISAAWGKAGAILGVYA
jgi:PHS family inorganic phosphate transporter-like MFS transporter